MESPFDVMGTVEIRGDGPHQVCDLYGGMDSGCL